MRDLLGTNDWSTGDDLVDRDPIAPGRVTLTSRLGPRAVQAKSTAALAAPPRRPDRTNGARELDLDGVHDTAAHGVAGAGGPLPFLDRIQRSFGHHDVSGVAAHTDGAAASAAGAIGAQAYAIGDQIAFGGAPDLHTAAHEAAHVVQQRRGVSLKGGVGAAGDPYERHADAVAELVVRGESAATLLDTGPGGGGGGPAVQRLGLDDIGKGVSAANGVLARTIALVMPGNLIAAQIIGSVAIDDTLAGLLNTWIAGYITADLDQKAAALIDQGVKIFFSGGVAAALPVLDGLDAVLAVWAKIPEPLQQVLMYIVGRFLQSLENLFVKLCKMVGAKVKEETNGEGEPINSHLIVQYFELPAMAASAYADKLRLIVSSVRGFFGAPVTATWQAFGGYISRKIVDMGWSAASWLTSWVPRGALPDDKPDKPALPPVKSAKDQISASDLVPKAPLPSGTGATNVAMRKVNIGPMAIVPEKFGIVQTTKEKLGGLEVAAGLEFNLLESGATVPKIDGAARIDWDGKFSWDVAVNDVTLLAKANLGFMSIDEIKLKKIQANDKFMELGLSAKAVKVGSFLETGAVQFTWNSQTGLSLGVANVGLKLPDPLSEVKGSLAMEIDRAGKLGMFQLTDLSAGKSFSIARAAYTKDAFAIEDARYQLPDAAFGPGTAIGFGGQIARDGKLLGVKGKLTVNNLKPFGNDTLVLGGTMMAGYDASDGFSFGLENAHLAAKYKAFSGTAQLTQATYKQKGDRFTADLPSFVLQAGPVQVVITGAKLDRETGISAASGSVRFIPGEGKDALKSLPGLSDWKTALGLAGSLAAQVMSAQVVKPSFTKADGLKWDRIETAIDMPDHAQFNLFGGLLSGMYDRKAKKAELGSHFTYPPAGTNMWPRLFAEYHFVPGLGVFVELGMNGGITAGVKANVEPAKDGEDLVIGGQLALAGSLGVSVGAGFMAGSAAAIAARLYMEGSATLLADGQANFKGTLVKQKDKPSYKFKPGDGDGTVFDYNFTSKLIAQLALVVDVAAFMVFSKRLARVNLKTWELGNFTVAGKFQEDESGKFKHVLLKPDEKKKGKDATFDAFAAPPKLDASALEPVPVEAAIEILLQKGTKTDDPRFANRLITDIEEAALSADKKDALRKKVEMVVKTEKGKEKETTTMLTGFAEEAKKYTAERALGGLGVTSRIMTVEQWIKYSDIRVVDSLEAPGSSTRKTITKVDEAIRKYHAIKLPEKGTAAQLLDVLTRRNEALAELKKACEVYIEHASGVSAAMQRKGRRKDSVMTLLGACRDEQLLLEPFFERAKAIVLNTPKDPVAKKND